MAGLEFGIRVYAQGIAEFRRNIQAANTDLNTFGRGIQSLSGTTNTLGRNISQFGSTITGVGRSLSIFVSGPVAALTGTLTSMGIQFEDAFAGVTKTVDGLAVGFEEIADAAQSELGITITTMDEAREAADLLGMEFGDLTEMGIEVRDQFREMGNEVPIPINELARLGEVVGQLGVGGEDIADVTRLISLFGVTTDMSAEQAAFGIIRFGNIMEGVGLDVEDWTRRAGSAVIALGNNSVSSEEEILGLSNRIAAAGDRANFSAQEVLAWATTLSDVGVRSELGGTAVSRAITEMLLAVQQGGEGLEAFAAVSGMSAEEFQRAFEEDASAALLNFVGDLKTAFEQGLVTEDMLKDMGLSGVRAIDVIGRLGNVQELFSQNLETANTAWEEQIALENEAEKRFATIESQIQLVKNAFADLGIEIFDLVRDDIAAFLEGIRNVISFFKDLDPSIQRAILMFAGIVAALGPVLAIAGLFITAIGGIVTALSGIVAAVGAPVIIIGVLIAALAGLAVALAGPETVMKNLKSILDSAATTFNNFKAQVIELWESLIPDFTRIRTSIEALGGLFQDLGIGELFLDSGILESVGNLATTMFENISEAIRNTVQDVSDFVEGFRQGLTPFIEEAGPKIEEFFSKVREAIDALAPLHDALFEMMSLISGNQDFETLGEALGFIAGIGFEMFIAGLTRTVETLTFVIRVVTEVIRFISDMRETFLAMPEILGAVAQTIFDVFNQVITDISTFFSQLSTSISTGIDTAIQRVVDSFTSFQTLVEGTFSSIKSSIIGQLEEIKLAFSQAITNLLGEENVQRLSEVPRKIGEIVTVIRENIVGELIELRIAILEWATSIVTPVVDKFVEIQTRVVGTLTGLWNQIVQIFTTIRDIVAQKIEEIRASLFQKTDQARIEVTSKFEQIKQAVLEKITSLIAPLIEKFTLIRDRINERINEIKESILNVFTNIRDAVDEKVQELRDGINEKIELIKERVSNLFQEMKEAVVQSVRDMVSDTLDSFDRLYEDIVGHSIVPDLVKGVLSEFAAMNTALTEEGGIPGMVNALIGEFSALGVAGADAFSMLTSDVGSAAVEVAKATQDIATSMAKANTDMLLQMQSDGLSSLLNVMAVPGTGDTNKTTNNTLNVGQILGSPISTPDTIGDDIFKKWTALQGTA